VGQQIVIGTGADAEIVEIVEAGTAGATTVSSAINAGATIIPVESVVGFSVGQTITIGTGTKRETAVISSVTYPRRNFGNPAAGQGASITVSKALRYAHALGDQVSGSGLILSTGLLKTHREGVQVSSGLPTPGKANRF
jgi:hypothetical protein